MSSRQEEKAARKAEREAQEAAARKAAARSKRLQLVAGAVVVLLILGGSAYALTSGGNDGGSKNEDAGQVPTVPIPAPKGTDLKTAAAAAHCVLLNPPNEGSTHVQTNVTYKSNPPTSGNHNPVPASDGIYKPGNEPTPEHFVHALEHGRIEIQYRPGTPLRTVNQLQTLGLEAFNGSKDYHALVFENNTNMPYAVAATAWGHLLGCQQMSTGFFDAVRAFRKAYTDKGPELIPGRE